MIVSQKAIGDGIPPAGGGVGVVEVNCHVRSLVVSGAGDVEIDLSNQGPFSPSPISSWHGAMKCYETRSEGSSESVHSTYIPIIRSGSYADIGQREVMEDEHICVDDLSIHLGPIFKSPTSFYGVFDGHGGSAAASYIKKNAIKFFFKDAELPQVSIYDPQFMEELATGHRNAYLLADIALSAERTVSNTCGTTSLTAIVIGRRLLIANSGDCRAVLCRNGAALELTQDHRPSLSSERERVERAGGFIDDGDYLNGELSVTRALGDWFMKPPLGSFAPLIADPEVRQLFLSEEDEFLIIGCDGIWDVLPSQAAVSLVRRGLRRHDDPERCARELVMEASRLNSNDNLTAVVVCFTSPKRHESCLPQGRRPRFSGVSDEARSRLKCFVESRRA